MTRLPATVLAIVHAVAIPPLLVVAAAPAAAQAPAPPGPAPNAPAPISEAPLPPERPADLPPAAAPEAPKDAPDASGRVQGPEAPLPPGRPDGLAVAPASGPAALTPEETACRERLTSLGVTWKPATLPADEVCGATNPLEVSKLPEGLAIVPPAVTVCPMAEALAHWSGSLRGEATSRLGQAPTKLINGGSYVCRGQDHETEAKLSEHAFADAIDVMGLGFGSRPDLMVPAKDGTPEAGFLTAVRASACTNFTTVLGPGSDAYHANHFHLDLRARRGGFRICQ